MKKVIITGANGQVGSYMSEHLLNEGGLNLILAVRRTSHQNLENINSIKDHPFVKVVSMDLNDSHSIQSLVQNEKPDYFLNFGASAFVSESWNSPELYMKTNTISLIHILESIKNFAPNCRLYSSGSTDQINPKSIYGVSKNASSQICDVYRNAFGIYAVQGITASHESCRRPENYLSRKITKGVARIFASIIKNKDFDSIKVGNVETSRDWSHVLDFVDGIWRMVNQEKYRSDLKDKDIKFIIGNLKNYTFCSNRKTSIKELISTAFSCAAVKCRWEGEGINSVLLSDKDRELVKVDKSFFRPAEADQFTGNNSEAIIDLGWSPKYSFEKMIDEMVTFDIKEVLKPVL